MVVDDDHFPSIALVNVNVTDLRDLFNERRNQSFAVKERIVKKCWIPKGQLYEVTERYNTDRIRAVQQRFPRNVGESAAYRPRNRHFLERPVHENQKFRGESSREQVQRYSDSRNAYEVESRGAETRKISADQDRKRRAYEISKGKMLESMRAKPRYVLPARGKFSESWRVAQHKKFPRPPTRTQKRRLLRERAIARREESVKLRNEPTIDVLVSMEPVGSKSKFGRSDTEDKFVEDDDDLLSEEDDQTRKTINFCVGEFHITMDCATGVVILLERFKMMEKEDGKDELQVDELLMEPSQMEDGQHEVQDPLEKINLGELENPKVVYVSKLLGEQLKQDLISTLKEYRDCFAWSYDDMPGLDQKLVEHRLPLKEGFKPFQQPSRRMSKEVELKVKEEVEKLLKAKFIKPIRYTEWLSNIVPVMKKNGKVRICIDFRDLNCATPKDVYVMPIPDMLIDSVARHELLSFMDGFSGYNQIKIAEADTHKTAFRCPGAVGTFEWLVMLFGLKNAGATYQRAMNSIFHDMIGHHIEVYIDDIVVKSKQAADHIEHLRKSFQRMRQHELKLNPLKCAFGVKAGKFLGFLVHQRGVEVDKNKAKAIMEANPPRNKKELQRFLGQVNYLRRFIPNLAGKTNEFSQLLKLKDSGEFKWEESHQKAFDVIKRYLSNPPVLMPPRYGMPLKLYISAAHKSIGCLLVQNNHEGNEQAIYYLSRFLTLVEVVFPVCGVGVQPWELKFDGSSTETAAGAAEYEALVIGLEILKDLGARELLISGDSQLVLKQLSGEFKCTSLSLAPYYTAASQLLDDFEEVSLVHVPRQKNWEAEALAQVASGLKMSPELTHRLVLIQKKNHPSIQQRGIQVDTLNLDINLAGDWMDDM
ncbi:uncharacterized protein LOC142533477 [Primulina tabacum]|uniref:uncharacterized protein LOC142533477 n=1 Tax=Primulina tabacum TaxID=48773 RepID=UPI003F5A439D